LQLQQGHKDVILVGAGVGGWVMLHAAQKMAASVVGLVGIAAGDKILPSSF
jgi:hypothetical protein